MTYKLAIVGEAWGSEEAKALMPFQGPSGWLLNQLLESANIRRADCFLTNVFNLKPEPANDISNLCGPKADSDFPPVSSGKYIRREFNGEIQRLQSEINDIKPNLVLALGGTALWALTGNAAISKNRGSVTACAPVVCRGIEWRKVLPVYHPAAILRDYSLLPVTYADFAKAARERDYPEIRRPQRAIYIEPTLTDITALFERWRYAKRLAIDIETRGDVITCIGFAPSTREALVIPFEDPRKAGRSYWSSFEERQAWEWVRKFCQLPAAKVLQNGLYDLHFLWRRYGITCVNAGEDTMLLHHSLQPESPKGLAYMGSVYTNEAAWKLMRDKGNTTIKREE